jgi:hypothetical protein
LIMRRFRVRKSCQEFDFIVYFRLDVVRTKGAGGPPRSPPDADQLSRRFQVPDFSFFKTNINCFSLVLNSVGISPVGNA